MDAGLVAHLRASDVDLANPPHISLEAEFA
jgi:hypothetical protein